MGMTSPGTSSARRRRRGGHAPMAEINVTPLVDVMLVLLIIFMVTAPLLTAAVPIDLPDSQAKPLETTPEAVTVSIERSGQVFLDKDQLSPGELPDRIAALAGAGNKPPQVTLRADRGLDYGRVMAVMGELNAAGVTQISLVTTGGGAPVSGGSAGRP